MPPELLDQHQNPLILVVDDEMALRQLVAKLLTKTGFGAVAAEGGREALALLDGGLKPDAIILDLLMPGMNGVEFVDAARASGHDVPTVLVSASPDAGDEARRLQLAGCLRKPYEISALLDLVRRVIRARAA